MMVLWTTSEWAQVVSAVFAAIAALAACGAALLSLAQQRNALRPNIGGGISRDAGGNLYATLTNAGPGIAYRVAYCILAGSEWRTGTPGTGQLAAGQEHVADLRLIRSKDDPVHMVWACQDVGNNIYIWSDDWRSRRFSRRRWLRRQGHSLKDTFRLMYPDVDA